MNELNEQQKVKRLYNLIGDRGLYVNTGYDLFTESPESIRLALGAGINVNLMREGSRAYSSPLLFATLTSLLNHGTMFITGAPGIGKTTGAEFAGHFFTEVPLDDIIEAEIIGNPQLKTEDVIANLDTVKMIHTGEKEVLPTKFLKCPVKIWDEINRTPSDLLSATMKLVDNGKAVYQGTLLRSPPGVLFATANYADEGTFQLTPPFLDRFDVGVMVTSPQPWDIKEIRARGDEKVNGELEKRLNIPEGLKLNLEKIRREIKEMPEADYGVSDFADFIYGSLRFSEIASDNLARATKGNAWQINQDNAPSGHFPDSPFNYTVNELSVRTAKAMTRYARAYAWLNGRDKSEINDLKAVLPYLIWHKIRPTSKALAENQRWANDRIGFAEGLIAKIEMDYSDCIDSEAFKFYKSALNILKTGKIKNKDLSKEEIRKVCVSAIEKIGTIDKPYAITMANHVATEYNTRMNRRNYD